MTEPLYKRLYRFVVGYSYAEDEPETVSPPPRKPPPDVEPIDDSILYAAPEPLHSSVRPRLRKKRNE